MIFIDSHSHIYDEAFDGDRDDVVRRAVGAGVAAIMCPAIDSGSHEALFGLCRRWPDVCLPMMGFHPTSVNDNPRWREELALVEKYLSEPPAGRIYAVGEIGLDLYWSRDWAAQQEEAFVAQLELALKHDLPVVIHTRDAWPLMREVLERYRDRGLRGVMHAFSGTLGDYEYVKGCGEFVFGIGGPITYKKSTMPDVVSQMAIEDIVLETDSPYLPPVPHRGQRNESSYLSVICAKVAEIKGLAPYQVADTTTANARRIFGMP